MELVKEQNHATVDLNISSRILSDEIFALRLTKNKT